MNGVGDSEAREIGHEPPEEIAETEAPDVQGAGMDEATNLGGAVGNTPTPAAPAPAPLTVNVSLGSDWLQQQQYGNHTPDDLYLNSLTTLSLINSRGSARN